MQEARAASLAMVFLVLLTASASAQGKSHGYVSVGAGATNLNGGVDWIVGDGPIGIGGEMGIGWAFFRQVAVSYHFFDATPRRHDVFATLGYAGMSSSEFSSRGLTIGGGMTYWAATRLGVRVDAFRYLATETEHEIPLTERSPSKYWGLRVGVAFRFR